MTDQLIRNKFHEALDVVQPDPNLRSRVIHALPADQEARRTAGSRSREWMLSAVAVAMAVVTVAGLLYLRIPRVAVPSQSGEHAISRAGSGMVTPDIGWAISGSNLLRTTDAGYHWSRVSPSAPPSSFLEPYFLDGTHAWLAEAGDSWPIVVYRTSDGGATWQRSRPITLGSTQLLPPGSIFFIDRLHGWLLLTDAYSGPSNRPGDHGLFATVDGGATWTQLSDASSQLDGCSWGTVVFSSQMTGWITTLCPSTGGPALLVSRDGGVTWTEQALPVAVRGSMPGTLNFFGSLNGTLLAEGMSSTGVLLATADGGETWTVRALPGEVQTSVDFIDAEHGWAIGGTSAELSKGSARAGDLVPLYRTDDGGVSWLRVDTDLPLVSAAGLVSELNFVGETAGFAVGVLAPTLDMTLLRSTNGGRTWTLVGQYPH